MICKSQPQHMLHGPLSETDVEPTPDNVIEDLESMPFGIFDRSWVALLEDLEQFGSIKSYQKIRIHNAIRKRYRAELLRLAGGGE